MRLNILIALIATVGAITINNLDINEQHKKLTDYLIYQDKEIQDLKNQIKMTKEDRIPGNHGLKYGDFKLGKQAVESKQNITAKGEFSHIAEILANTSQASTPPKKEEKKLPEDPWNQDFPDRYSLQSIKSEPLDQANMTNQTNQTSNSTDVEILQQKLNKTSKALGIAQEENQRLNTLLTESMNKSQSTIFMLEKQISKFASKNAVLKQKNKDVSEKILTKDPSIPQWQLAAQKKQGHDEINAQNGTTLKEHTELDVAKYVISSTTSELEQAKNTIRQLFKEKQDSENKFNSLTSKIASNKAEVETKEKDTSEKMLKDKKTAEEKVAKEASDKKSGDEDSFKKDQEDKAAQWQAERLAAGRKIKMEAIASVKKANEQFNSAPAVEKRAKDAVQRKESEKLADKMEDFENKQYQKAVNVDGKVFAQKSKK